MHKSLLTGQLNEAKRIFGGAPFGVSPHGQVQLFDFAKIDPTAKG